MDEAEALRRNGLNLAAYVAHNAHHAPGGAVDERDGLLCFVGAHPYPGTHTNGIIRTTADLPAADAIRRAKEFFAPRRFSFTIWIRGEQDADLELACQAEGFELRPPIEGMPATGNDQLISFDTHPLHEDAELVRVSDAATARDYLRVVGEGFSMNVPDDVIAKIWFDPSAFFDPRVQAFIAYLDGVPVTVCLTFVEHGFAGLYSAATIEASRGKGLARATLGTASNAGMNAGAEYAGGQSAEMGSPTWTRMGFRTLALFRRYIGRPE